MRIQQITAAVTRRLFQTGIRAIDAVDTLVHTAGLHLCLAYVSLERGSYAFPSPSPELSGRWSERMPNSPPVNFGGPFMMPRFGELKRLSPAMLLRKPEQLRRERATVGLIGR
ncbi:MAG: hypothetical protein AAF802_29385 [Planctomycetota bacterium]